MVSKICETCGQQINQTSNIHFVCVKCGSSHTRLDGLIGCYKVDEFIEWMANKSKQLLEEHEQLKTEREGDSSGI